MNRIIAMCLVALMVGGCTVYGGVAPSGVPVGTPSAEFLRARTEAKQLVNSGRPAPDMPCSKSYDEEVAAQDGGGSTYYYYPYTYYGGYGGIYRPMRSVSGRISCHGRN